jgi:hypothetical protein
VGNYRIFVWRVAHPSQPMPKKTQNKQYRPKRSNNYSQVSKLITDLKSLKEQYSLNSPQIALQKYQKDQSLRNRVDDIDYEHPMKKKLRKLEVAVGEKFMDAEMSKDLGLKYGTLTANQKLGYIESVLADDFGSLLGIAARYVAPYIKDLAMAYGPKVIDWVYNKALSVMGGLKEKGLRSIRGHGSGPGVKYTPNPEPMELEEEKIDPSMVMETERPPPEEKIMYSLPDMNTVCKEYICAVLCPENYTCLYPNSTNANIACASKENTWTWNSAADGNGVIYYFGDYPQANGTSPSVQLYYNPTGTSTSVNVVTGSPSAYVGMFGEFGSLSTTLMTESVTIGSSIRIVLTQPELTAQGNVTLCAFTDDVNVSVNTTTPAVPLITALNAPYVHAAAVSKTTELRQIHIPHAIVMTELQAATNNNTAETASEDIVVAYLTGTVPNTAIAQIYTWASINYAIGPQALQLINTQSPPDGPASSFALASILKRMPHLAQLTLDEAIDFASYIANLPYTSFKNVVGGALQYGCKFKKRPKTFSGSVGGSSQLNQSIGSMDEISF